MKQTNFEAILELVKDNRDSETREAFIAALIMERCTTIVPDYQAGEGVANVIPALKPHIAALAAKELTTIAQALDRLAVQDCNHGLLEHQEKRREALTEKFGKLAHALGFDAETGGDPRGCVAKLHDPDDKGSGDNWGGGWGVY